MYQPPSPYHVNFNQVSFEKRASQVLTIDDNLRNLILIDCASTINLFINALLLLGIGPADIPLYLNTNNGVNVTIKKGMYKNIEVSYNKSAIANVLSYGLLADDGRVAGDSKYHSSIFYYSDEIGWIEFEKLGCGLYAFDTENSKTNKPTFLDYLLVQTVNNRKSLYSSEQIKRAEGVRKLYAKIG